MNKIKAQRSRSRAVGRSSSRVAVQIVPFKKPPAPPADLYDRSVGVLMAATRDRASLGSSSLPSRPHHHRSSSPTSVLGSDQQPKPTVAPSSSECSYYSAEELVRYVDDLCVHGHSRRLLVDVRRAMDDGAVACIERLVGKTLEDVQTSYKEYTSFLAFVTNVFTRLNPTTLHEAGLASFRRAFEPRAKATVDLVLKELARERAGENVDADGTKPLVRATLRMLADLGLREAYFVQAFTDNVGKAYAEEGTRFLSSEQTGSSFAAHVESRWVQAVAVGRYYGDPHVAKTYQLVEEHLIKPHVEYFLAPAVLYPLLEDETKFQNDLRRLYVLLDKVGALEGLRTATCHWGRYQGHTILATANTKDNSTIHNDSYGKTTHHQNSKEIVPRLIDWKKRLETIHSVAFQNDGPFGDQGLRGILEDVLNGTTTSPTKANAQKHPVIYVDDPDSHGRRVAELLARHVDYVLRSTRHDATESTQELMGLFRHSQSKDVFEGFYKLDLARRLLTGRSTSVDAERTFLGALRVECGPVYTSKAEGMFKDMELSRQFAASSSSAAIIKGTDVQILTTGYWPHYPQCPTLVLPPEVELRLKAFEKHYASVHQGRRIAWQHSLGQCHLKARFPECGERDLVTSHYQALVLLHCFSDPDPSAKQEWTLMEVAVKLGLQEDLPEVERLLLSLSCGKDGTRVLQLSSKKKKIGPTDVVRFHSGFSSSQKRIRISALQRPSDRDESRTKTHDAVCRNRLNLIDAATVRILKARKTLSHQVLVGEVLHQLRFPATGTDVKKRFESLIEREYMERCPDRRDHYNYLA